MAQKDTSRILILKKSVQLSRGRLVRSRILFAGASWGAGSNPSVANSIFFLSSFFFLPFLLFILTADPVSFARFLRNVFLAYVIKIYVRVNKRKNYATLDIHP